MNSYLTLEETRQTELANEQTRLTRTVEALQKKLDEHGWSGLSHVDRQLVSALTLSTAGFRFELLSISERRQVAFAKKRAEAFASVVDVERLEGPLSPNDATKHRVVVTLDVTSESRASSTAPSEQQYTATMGLPSDDPNPPVRFVSSPGMNTVQGALTLAVGEALIALGTSIRDGEVKL